MRIEGPIARFRTKVVCPPVGRFRFTAAKQLAEELARRVPLGADSKTMGIENLIPELANPEKHTCFTSFFEYKTFSNQSEGFFWLRTKRTNHFRDGNAPYKPFLLITFNFSGDLLGIGFSLDQAATTFILQSFPEIGLFRELLDYLGNPYLTKSRALHIKRQLEAGEEKRQIFEQEQNLIVPKTTRQRALVECPPLTRVSSVYIGGYGFASANGHARYLATWGLGPCFALILYDRQRRVGSLTHFYANSLIAESIRPILSRFGPVKLTARIIGGDAFTDQQKLWEAYWSLPEGAEIVEEDILGNRTRSILFDTVENELYNIKGDYWSPEAPPSKEIQSYLYRRIRRLFTESMNRKNRKLLLDAAPDPTWFQHT